jgi:hypothetical protein
MSAEQVVALHWHCGFGLTKTVHPWSDVFFSFFRSQTSHHGPTEFRPFVGHLHAPAALCGHCVLDSLNVWPPVLE